MGRSDRFVGRASELAAVRSVLAAAADGHGRMVLVGGEPGIGKTRLAEEAAVHARERGMSVVWGRCWDGDSGPGYWPWIQVLRALAHADLLSTAVAELGSVADELARLVPDVVGGSVSARPSGDVEAEGARFRLFDGMGQVLAAAAERTPLLVVLDDLHRADEPSVAMLGFAARALHTARVVVIGTYRDVEVTDDRPLADLLGELGGDAVRLDLFGLSADEVGELVRDAERGVELHSRTAGNPFFVQELSKLLVVSGDQRPSVPASVREVLERRLARLPAACVHLLEVAAVIGQDFAVELVAGSAGLHRQDVVERLDDALAAGLLRRDRDAVRQFAFCHALLRETVYEGLPAMRRAALHRDVAETLEAETARLHEDVATVAHHYVHAIDAGTAEQAVRFSRRAGEEALARLAYEEAVRHYQRALDAVAPSDQRVRVELLRSLGSAQRWVGSNEDSRATFTKVAEAARELGDAALLAEAALGYSAPGNDVGLGVAVADREALDLFEEASAGLEPEDGALKARLLSAMAHQLYWTDHERCEELAAQARAVAERVDEQAAVVAAAMIEASLSVGRPQATRVVAAAHLLVDRANAVGDARGAMHGHFVAVGGQLSVGDVSGAQREIDAYGQLAEWLRIPAYAYPLTVWSAMRALLDGQFDRAEQLAADAVTASRPSGYGDFAYLNFAAQLFAVRREQGRLDELESAARDVAARPNFADEGCAYLALLLAELGRTGEAGDVLRRVDVDALADGPRHWEWLNVWFHLALACAEVGDEQLAARLYELGLPHSPCCVTVGAAAQVAGPVDHALGQLAGLLQRWSVAESHFETALERCVSLGSAPLLARTRCEFARMLVARATPGDLDRARELAGQALATAEGLGMVSVVDRVRKALDAVEAGALPAYEFRRDGGVWRVVYGEETAHLRDAKGLYDLSILLAAPGREVHVTDLVPEGAAARSLGGDTVLDDHAKAAYRARIKALDQELAGAEFDHDLERSARLRAERDAIVDQLAKAAGLGGRARPLGDETERVRKTVTVRIRRAIRDIGQRLPGLGAHLSASVHTGTYCSYRPAQPTHWRVR